MWLPTSSLEVLQKLALNSRPFLNQDIYCTLKTKPEPEISCRISRLDIYSVPPQELNFMANLSGRHYQSLFQQQLIPYTNERIRYPDLLFLRRLRTFGSAWPAFSVRFRKLFRDSGLF